MAKVAVLMGGASFERGFGSHPEGAITFRSNGKVTAFDAFVALDDDSTNAVPYRAEQKAYGGPEAVFKIWADGKIVWKSAPLHPGEKHRYPPYIRHRHFPGKA